ncbi:type III pantothenate kinase [Sinomicrobium weinanense]|uniref:Type III pantothenate kinase n=1 Tax=Sinomicrobium weinanense TaxID=2842200 RepID=A0A926Q4Y5_9FLAO|nr:type III pantothenate kinase [Sinomicrobium weinanense]MBC9797576.1 type III pantothenate kinase [Sinomicrobium weinanense]MBU3123643.1 type III pantothenate kinase [Sinomicrobium weinanense]
MTLAVDAGNTLVKIAVFQSDDVLYAEKFPAGDFLKKNSEILEKYPSVTDMIVASVADIAENDLRALAKKVRLHILGNLPVLPFSNRYATPETLGADRVALVSAASRTYPGRNVLVIDSGTCITYDFLNEKNEYLGGAISPGIRMRYKALHTFTAKLPLIDADRLGDVIGNSTATSISSGVLNGVVNEIDGIIAQYRQRFQHLTVILTGGDLDFLSKQLKSSIFANPNFLLEGLNFIMELNKNQ